MIFRVTAFIFLIWVAGAVQPASGQQNDDFQIANQLMQQQRYDEALPILESLHEKNPSAFIFFDRYTECLLNLKKTGEAEAAARKQISENYSPDRARIKLAEILHLRGEKEEALRQWQQTLDRNAEEMQMYYAVASSMLKRGEYETAVEAYRQAQKSFDNRSLFLNELADTYMQAGLFEESVREYLNLMIESPDQISIVQQRFLRMNDNQLYEIAAFEIEDHLLELEETHEAYPNLYHLLTWLLLETEEYRRALVFSRQYETATPHTIYSLFSLGHQLESAGEYELAAEAFEYYIENGNGSVRYRAMDELAFTYQHWAQYLQQNNLEEADRYRTLFQKAYDTNEQLLETAPDYNRADRVVASIVDLSLDEFKDLQKAEYWYRKMDELQLSGEDAEANRLYAEGRIALYKNDFVTARQALTRADKTTERSSLSEKARFYLSLADFFAGDFEFAEIQLRSLERRQTSYYANDAIKLRMWIADGQRADTTGGLLNAVAGGLHAIHTGNYNEALKEIEPVLAQSAHPFSDDLSVEISSVLPEDYHPMLLKLLERQIRSNPSSPLRERMLWNRAMIAEQLAGRQQPPDDEIENMIYQPEFLTDAEFPEYQTSDIPALYEEILMEYPDGFYASYAREKIQNLQMTSVYP